MNESKVYDLIEKLRKVTQARGATPAEEALAREKIRVLSSALRQAPKRMDRSSTRLEVYVDGWPGQPICHHQLDHVNARGRRVCRKCGCEYL